MQISNIKIRRIDSESVMKAIATVTFNNCIVVRDVKIIVSPTNTFVAMPSKKMKDGTFKDICYPITKDCKEYIDKAIMSLYYSEETERNFEVETKKPEMKCKIRNINNGEVKTVHNDHVVGVITATFDDCFVVENITAILTNDNKIDFDFPYRVTPRGTDVFICEILNYAKEYSHELFEIVRKEIEEGRMIISPNEELNKSEDMRNDKIDKPIVIASAFYPDTIRMIIENISNGKDVNERDSILKLILESSNKFEENNNEITMYFYNNAKIVYHFENNKLQYAIGTLEDGHSYKFDRKPVEERFLNTKNEVQNKYEIVGKTPQELFMESMNMLKIRLDESDT